MCVSMCVRTREYVLLGGKRVILLMTNLRMVLSLLSQIQGRTRLPIPTIDESRLNDKETIHSVEGAVVTWSRQIREVLKASLEGQLKNMKCPGPMVELQYWEDRAANLNGIQEQLENGNVKMMIKSLEDSQSTYFPAFQR